MIIEFDVFSVRHGRSGLVRIWPDDSQFAAFLIGPVYRPLPHDDDDDDEGGRRQTKTDSELP